MSSASPVLTTPPPTSAMTGAGQRMPTQQAIILRPGQQSGLVSVPASQQQMQQPRQPILVNSAGVRVQGPGVGAARAAATITANRNVVINQPGSQITVPLHTLQSMQPGQGIPTGQAGHLLVKTENGQYQILRVGPSTTTANVTLANSPHVVRTVTTQVQQQQQQTRVQVAASTAAAATTSMSPSTATTTSAAAAAAAAATTANSSSASSSGGMGTQMTPETAKLKCKNFLATLLRLAGEQPANVATNVRNLIQGLIDGRVDPETFTTKLQRELNSSPQPCLVPFLKKSLPHLQQSLVNGEMSIAGVRAPPRSSFPSMMNVTVVRPPATTNIGLRPAQPQMAVVRTMTPTIRTMSPMQQQAVKNFNVPRAGLNTSTLASGLLQQQQLQPPQIMKEKKAGGGGNSYSVTGDEDINDVAAMGGVNIAEESQRMQGGIVAGTQIRSCKDETFLQTGLLAKRVSKLCRDRGLEEPPSEVIALVSHATQDRLKTLLEKLSVISEHRLDIVRQEGDYEVTQDVKGQLRFLSELDKIERRRHEEAEREVLLRAAKSRTKTEDPEKEKLKAKAKELQRLEEEQQQHEKANNTALMAIGGPRKKLKLDEASGGFVPSASGIATSLASRPRMKRVHVRDLMFLMEQEKELKRSPLLWKAYCS